VGYDINCGVRLMATNVTREALAPRLDQALQRLFHAIPTGVGASGAVQVNGPDLRRAVRQGAAWSVEHGYGSAGDLAHIEEEGCLRDADPDAVSERAWQRGRPQLGTLGSGNHFLELGLVDTLYDETAARAMGLFAGQVTLMIHCGSRGFGHQVCDDFLDVMLKAARRYGIALPDRQLACAPVTSPEGQAYLGAMRCAVNFAFANRQVIAHHARRALEQALKISPAELGLRTVYEVAHNIAKIETHTVEGRPRRLCVHRKGATRAFGPGHPDVPSDYRAVGQPVLVPGDMGRYSFVLSGTDTAMRETFGSACHGAGRAMSRHQALNRARRRNVAAELRAGGVRVMAGSLRTLAEEMPEAYKDVAEVVDACRRAGLARPVARLKPLACIKG
jgi:tRNA-splicing ligase RtcB